MDYLLRINNDLYDIASRVKEIDNSYYIVYNTRQKRYEVHNEKSKPSLCLIVEGIPDARTLTRLRETHISRLKKIVEEIEKTNERVEKNKNQKNRDAVSYKTKNLINYLENGGREIPLYQDI